MQVSLLDANNSEVKHQLCVSWLQFPVRGEATVTVALPPKLELRCPPLAVANSSLEIKLVGWGAVGLDVDWTITKNGVQVAKGGI